MSDPTGGELVWVGRAPCGCALFVSVDEEPGTPSARDLNREVSALRRKGWTIESRKLQWVWDGGMVPCPHKKRKSKKPEQLRLA